MSSRSNAAIPLRLLRMAVLYAARIARLDDLCFVVHPRHREFHQSLFPFRRFLETRTYRRINRRPVIGFRMDLQPVRGLIRIERAGSSAGPLSVFLCGRQAATEVTAGLRRDLPRSSLTPLEWARLFGSASIPTASQAELSTFLVSSPLDAVNSEPGGHP